jgi:MYXO-CTERM domain-containing protein
VSARRFAVALLASLAVLLALPALRSLREVSLTGAVLLAQLAIASAPRSAGDDAWRASLWSAGALLPAIGLAVGLDVARGVSVSRTLPFALAGWLVLVAWSFAASAVGSSTRARNVFAGLWLAALPGSAVLWAALAWAPRTSAEDHAPGAVLAGVNALVWLQRSTRAGGLAETEASAGTAPLLLALLVALAVWLVRRRHAARSLP